MPPGQIQAIGGHKGCTVQKDMPSSGLSLFDPLQRMLHPGEIGLRWIGK